MYLEILLNFMNSLLQGNSSKREKSISINQ